MSTVLSTVEKKHEHFLVPEKQFHPRAAAELLH